jgi:hypothetical protein
MVYLFNATGSALYLEINGNQIAAPYALEKTTGYAPDSVTVDIKKLETPGSFSLGSNRVFARFNDFSPPLPGSKTYDVNLPGTTISEDYVLFLMADLYLLTRSSGEVIHPQTTN